MVALDEVHLDDAAVGALAQRLALHGGQGDRELASIKVEENTAETGSGPVDAPDQRGRAEHLQDTSDSPRGGPDTSGVASEAEQEKKGGGTMRRFLMALFVAVAVGGTLLAFLVIGILESR